MSKHTPGPWRVGDRAPYVEVWGPMRMNSYPILASMEHEPREANARLMASAPDLAQAAMKAWGALQWIMNYDSDDGILADARKDLEAAIEKSGTYDFAAMRARVEAKRPRQEDGAARGVARKNEF